LSGDEDVLPVPVEVLAGGHLSTFWQQERLMERGAAVVLPGERIGLGGMSQRAGD
jgi:hypothetical protein